MNDDIIAARNVYAQNEDGSYTLTITRTKSGDQYKVLIDAEDIDAAKQRCWRIATGNGCKYVASGDFRSGQQWLFLHHLLVGRPEAPLVVYYLNNDTLDCRRANLRVGTRSEAVANSRTAKLSLKTGYVTKSNNGKRFCAYVYDDTGKPHYHGTFDTREQAKAAHIAAGRKAA